MLDSFTLTVQNERRGDYTWRLKDSQFRYRGSGSFTGLIAQRIPVSETKLVTFCEVLDLLEVTKWQSVYKETDSGWITLGYPDIWSFAASIAGRECCCRGYNAYPSYSDVTVAITERGRFGLLIAAMYECFQIDSYIYLATQQRERNVERQADD